MVGGAEQVWKGFRETIEEHGLLRPGDTVIAGVSGGPDSLALLHLLWRLKEEAGWKLTVVVAHLNHGIRPEAEEEARFVAECARSLGLQSVIAGADVPALAGRPGVSLEEAARVARYRFLRETAHAFRADRVAVGHHADDQVETVLMHLMRGSGLAGLRGMQPAVPLREMRLGEPAPPSQEGEILLIRPLLACRREDILAYCQEYGLNPRFDLSNLDTTIFRNRLRHELVPYLEEYNPNMREVLSRTAAVLAQDYAYLHQCTLEVWGRLASQPMPGVIAFPRQEWEALHPSVQAGLLREAIHRLRCSLRDINWIHIHNALAVTRKGESGARATLPQGLMLTVGYAYIWVGEEGWEPAEGDYPQLAGTPSAVPVPGKIPLMRGWTISAELAARDALPQNWDAGAHPWRAYLDAEEVDLESLEVRRRLPGDRFAPLGMGGKKKEVRSLFIDRKIPRPFRRDYPLLADHAGILWIPGLHLDERARITPATTRVLVLCVSPPISGAKETD